MLFRRLSSPPSLLPPPLDAGGAEGAEATFTRRLITGKRLGLLSWRQGGASRQTGHVDFLVLGDSYADDIDMGFPCWPSLVAAVSGGSCLSVARGGSRSTHGVEQYERASSWMSRACKHTSERTVVIVHLGGNDVLHAMWLLGPLAFLLLGIDMAVLGAGRIGLLPRRSSLPRYSFFSFLARRITTSLATLLATLAQHGHARVLVSGLPICSTMPLARTITSMMTGAWFWPGGSQFVTGILDDAAALLGTHLRDTLRDAAFNSVVAAPSASASASKRPPPRPMRLLYFDEGEVLRRTNGKVWRDLHHPRAWVHAELGAAAQKLLRLDE